MGFEGAIVPINPKYSEVLGLPCSPSLSELDFSPDVVAFCVSSARVLPAFRCLPEVGAGAAVIFDGGFAETGEQGRQLQSEVVEISRQAGIALCGPNCMGLLNPARNSGVYAQLVHDPMALAGNVGLVSQSGSVCIGMMSDTRRFGFSLVYSSGNEAVVTTADLINYLTDDPTTAVIAVFSEFIADPDRFIAALDRAAEAAKPVVVLKVGRTARARRAVMSHTGGLCGESRVFSEVLRAHRAIEVQGLDEMTEVLAACQATHLPAGHRAAVVTASGGLAELMLDAAQLVGIKLPPLSTQDRAAIEEFMGPVSGDGNPLDAWGSGHFELNLPRALTVARSSDRYDMVVFPNDAFDGQPMGGPGFGPAYTPLLAESATASTKPHYQLNTRPGLMHRTQVAALVAAGGATLGGLQQGLRALARLAEFSQWSQRSVLEESTLTPEVVSLADMVVSTDGHLIHEHDAKRLMAGWGVPVTNEQLVTTLPQARRAAREIGFPVVLKAVSHKVAHRSDLGLVKIGLQDESELDQAWETVSGRIHHESVGFEGMVVAEMIDGGVEVLIGVSRDRDFGLVLAFGLGGFAVDASDMAEMALRVLPLRSGDAAALVNEAPKAASLLGAYRGRPPCDTEALTDCIEALGQFAWSHREHINEIDLNPVIVGQMGEGCTVVDALIVPRSC